MANRSIALVATSILVAFAIFYIVSIYPAGETPLNQGATTAPASEVPLTISHTKPVFTPSLRVWNSTKSDKIAGSVDRRVVDANTEFALRLLGELQSEEPGKNIVISPLSISTVLAMVYNGASGSTRDAMARTLGIENLSVDEVNNGYATLAKSLMDMEKSVLVNFADSIWVENGVASDVKPGFKGAMEQYYGGEVYVRDFGNNNTLPEMNGWVSNQTAGKVTNIIDSIPANNVMFLFNTIFFRGNWSGGFVEWKTSQGNFTREDGSRVDVPMMSGYVFESSFDNATGAGSIRLPYGKGRLVMYVILPPRGTSLRDYLAGLTTGKLNETIAGMEETELIVRFPKMSLEYAPKGLKAALTSLGMGEAFDWSAADFSNMFDSSVWVDDVYHKTVVEVNERGTTAAGASTAGVAMGLSSPPEFAVDRPFVFLIRDDRTGSILLIGAVYDPTQTYSP